MLLIILLYAYVPVSHMHLYSGHSHNNTLHMGLHCSPYQACFLHAEVAIAEMANKHALAWLSRNLAIFMNFEDKEQNNLCSIFELGCTATKHDESKQQHTNTIVNLAVRMYTQLRVPNLDNFYKTPFLQARS